MQKPRILIVGAGGIGGVIASYLNRNGHHVTSVTTNLEIHEAVKANGFRFVEKYEDGPLVKVPGTITLGVPRGEFFDFVLLAVQPPQVEEAAAQALPALKPDGDMICLQNGLCEERIAKLVGSRRVIGAVVAWGASMPEPGLYERTSAGGFVLGRLDGSLDNKVEALKTILSAVGEVAVTHNLRGARWSKLAINCAVSTMGTIAGSPVGPVIRVRNYRRLGLDVFTEVVAVARAEKVELEKVAGTIDLYWMALTERERISGGSAKLAAKHAVLWTVGLKFRRLRSSMLSAIERGRKPAIDFLNGEVVSRARKHGIAVPVNAMLVDMVHAISAKQERSSFALLDRVYNATRDEVARAAA